MTKNLKEHVIKSFTEKTELIPHTIYFKHSHGCGSGRTSAHVKIYQEKDEKFKSVEIVVRRWWMGRYIGKSNFSIQLIGKLLPIDGPYSIIKLTNGMNLTSEEKLNFVTYFDFFYFNKTYRTEWGSHDVNDLPIGLYAGNGASSTEKFCFYINKINTPIIDETDFEGLWKACIEIIAGMKFEISDEESFTKFLEHTKQHSKNYCQ